MNVPNTTGYNAHIELLEKSCITIDDNNPSQNPDPIAYGGLYVANSSSTFRGGTHISTLRGPLFYSFGKHRIATLSTSDLTFDQSTNTRKEVPNLAPLGTLIAVANLLNYWTTIGTSSTLRGADSDEEFLRQYTKTVLALSYINADVFGFVELENGPASSIDLLGKLNNSTNKIYQSAFLELGYTTIGSDVIKVDVFYDSAKFTLVDGAILTDSDVPMNILGRSTLGYIFNGASRVPLAVTLEELSSGEMFTIIVNHFKSKGDFSGNAIGLDDDLNDGAGHYNLVRTLSSEALIHWIENDS